MTKAANGQCTWGAESSDKDPHTHCPLAKKPKILDNVMQHIGNTPLVKINKIAQAEGLECDLLAKCEFFNAGGSVKDRIGKRMVEDAMASGRIKPGDTLIEPTSGNTGIGLALAAAVYGFRMIITLPEKMSKEKVDVLKALGAEIIRTPTEAAWDSPESHIGVANRLNKEIPNSHILDQYTNPSNPLAHYDGTAEEILEQCGGHVDMVVIGAGTGGTISGIGRKLKEKCPDCIVVGVDPVGSILAQPESLNDENKLQPYAVEGIGYDFIPDVLDRGVVDRWYKSKDKESFAMSRRLIREEGLLCGGSSGTAMYIALQAAKELRKGQKCVVILPDSVRNYMTKFLSDDWMREQGFMDKAEIPKSVSSTWWAKKTVADLTLQPLEVLQSSTTCSEAVKMMQQSTAAVFGVVSEGEEEKLAGVISEATLSAALLPGAVAPSARVSQIMDRKLVQLQRTASLAEASQLLNKHGVVISPAEGKGFNLLTRMDLLNYITSEQA